MQLELGQLIIDTQEDLNDIGVVVEVGWQHSINDGVTYPYCKIFWVCRRTHGLGDYTSTLIYSEEELEMEELARKVWLKGKSDKMVGTTSLALRRFATCSRMELAPMENQLLMPTWH